MIPLIVILALLFASTVIIVFDIIARRSMRFKGQNQTTPSAQETWRSSSYVHKFVVQKVTYTAMLDRDDIPVYKDLRSFYTLEKARFYRNLMEVTDNSQEYVKFVIEERVDDHKRRFV